MDVVELAGDHSEDERALLHDGEENPFESLHLGLYWDDHERRIVVRHEGRPVAAAGLIVAPVEAGGMPLSVVGIGGVIVTRSRRGQGLARRVMVAALECAARLGPDHALLFCRPDRAGLYRKLGFARVDGPVDVGQLDGARREMPLDTMWRPLHAGATWPSGPVSVPGLPF